LAVKANYFRATHSENYLHTVTPDGETLYVRAWWDTDHSDDMVVFMRLGLYPELYVYVAVSWTTKAILGTACASTDKQARRVLLDDLERRGYEFH
jgi:hypothetical protein